MGTDGKVRFGRNGTALVTSTTALNDGSWHHVVYTNASTGSNRAKLYVDGSLAAQATHGRDRECHGQLARRPGAVERSWTGLA